MVQIKHYYSEKTRAKKINIQYINSLGIQQKMDTHRPMSGIIAVVDSVSGDIQSPSRAGGRRRERENEP